MEAHLAQLIESTQQSETAVRNQAELELNMMSKANPNYAPSLAHLSYDVSVKSEIRQGALILLKKHVDDHWAPDDDESSSVHVPESAKDQLRSMMLQLVLQPEGERKIRTIASNVIGKIASLDFPAQWPDLVSTLLDIVPTANEAQLHGTLRVLQDLVDDSLSETQFFTTARDIIKVVYDIAINENFKASLRSLAINVFRSCFDLMDIVNGSRKKEVKAFADEALKAWLPFFLHVMQMQLPAHDGAAKDGQPDSWAAPISLKLQVVKTLIKIRIVFPALLLPQSMTFFEATWQELSQLLPLYQAIFVEGDAQGRLEDSDGLPFSLDFLVLEEIDFLSQCLRAPHVQQQLEGQIAVHGAAHKTPWVLDLMKICVGYSVITQEEEGLWDVDVSLYLAEEACVSSNYTPRIGCVDLLIKFGEWLNQRGLEGLFAYTKTIFTGDRTHWRSQEAALWLFNQIASDFQAVDRVIPNEIANAYLELVTYAVNCTDHPLLQARGYLVAGILARDFAPATTLLNQTIKAVNNESEVVCAASIRALEGFASSTSVTANVQIPIMVAIQKYLECKDLLDLEDADDLLIALLETLRAILNLNKHIVISDQINALDLFFSIGRRGASNYQVTIIVCEGFEDIVGSLRDMASYAALCSKVLPSITGAFDVATLTADDPLVTLAIELFDVLVQHGSEPLPVGFVASVFPKLNRLLILSSEGEILRPGAESVKYMLMHDHHQVFAWQDTQGRSGLETCLRIVDRLLQPIIEDNAASEVGGLAAELVEKAGQERLGPYLPQLLQAVANRSATAQSAPFIQSLILVFARLSLNGAHDVVEFLSQIQIDGGNGLHVVLGKWLENSINFAGYDEIRQNVIALSKLYLLNDPRVAQTMVTGDLIVPDTTRILTRSRAKQTPDQYTLIPAPLKILKVLIEELASASGMGLTEMAGASGDAEAADDDADDDDGWEDDQDTIDLSLGTTKAQIMSWIDSKTRHRDDETQTYLCEFFIRAARENIANFQTWYGAFTDEEKQKLQTIAGQ